MTDTVKTETDAGRVVHVNIPFRMLRSRLGEVVAQGINPEIYFDGDALDNTTDAELDEVASALSKAGLAVTMHGPYMDLSPGGADEKVRLATVDRFMETLDKAEVLRPAAIVLHAGYESRKFDGDMALWVRQSMKTWPVVVERAEAVGTKIALENVFERGPAPLKALMTKMGGLAVGVCVDVGHLNIFSEATMDEWFREVGEYVTHTHIHDNFGRYDDHLPIGDGVIDFGLFFELLKKYAPDAVYTIEPHGEEYLQPGLAAIQKYL